MIHSILHADRLEAPPAVSLPYQGWTARFVAPAMQAVRGWWGRLWTPEVRVSREWLAEFEQAARKHSALD
jgi:hypothetical protein